MRKEFFNGEMDWNTALGDMMQMQQYEVIISEAYIKSDIQLMMRSLQLYYIKLLSMCEFDNSGIEKRIRDIIKLIYGKQEISNSDKGMALMLLLELYTALAILKQKSGLGTPTKTKAERTRDIEFAVGKLR